MPTTTPIESLTNSERNSDLMDHIKRVLNLKPVDGTSIDQYVANAFNVHQQDPLYVFILPGEKNETIVHRRSDFGEAVFPNVTTLQMLRKIAQHSKWLQQSENADRKSEKFWKSDERFRLKYEQFKQNANDLDEGESVKIVEENVRTERNFFKFLDTLNVNGIVDNNNNDIDSSTETSSIAGDNSDSESQQNNRHLNEYETFLMDEHPNDHISNYRLANEHWESTTSKRPASTKVSWKDLGLDGWTGEIQSYHKNPEENA